MLTTEYNFRLCTYEMLLICMEIPYNSIGAIVSDTVKLPAVFSPQALKYTIIASIPVS